MANKSQQKINFFGNPIKINSIGGSDSYLSFSDTNKFKNKSVDSRRTSRLEVEISESYHAADLHGTQHHSA